MPLDYSKELEKLRSSIIEMAMKGEDQGMLLDLTVKTLSDQVIDSYQIGADFTTPDAEMLTRLVRDVWHFSGAKNYQEMRDLTLLLRDENGKLRNFDDFKEAANTVIDKYNENWLRTEYNFVVSASQNAGRWVEFEKEASVIPNLMYQTVGDNHVRATHQLLDGIIRPINDEFWNTHYPPNGWGCRCEAVQSLEGYGKVTPDKNIPAIPIPDMFQTNLAKTGLIFPKNHPYYFGVPRAEISKALSYLPPNNTFIDAVFGDGIEFEIHPLHGEKELSKNIDAVRTILNHDQNAKIRLMPVLNEKDIDARKRYFSESYLKKYNLKNPDILYNGRSAEIEVPNGSKSSIQNAIKHGKEQADFVLIRIPDNIDLNDIERIAKGQMKYYEGKESLTIWIYNSKEKRKFISSNKG